MRRWRWVWVAALAGCSAVQAAAVEVHPAGPSVPENLLRMELRFDTPQPLPFDSRRLQLLDGDGVEIEHALLDLTLPSADGRRLTVLMDPGRVKSGVGPNLDAGRALRAGETVSLRIAGGAADQPAVVKRWRVTAAVVQPLNTAAWQLQAPRAGSRDALTVDLREPVTSTGEALIAVVDVAGHRVQGRASLHGDDAVWRFTPARPWRAGPHRVVTHPDLEDPAGNRQCGAFEQRAGSRVACDQGAGIGFAPRPSR